MTITLSIKQEDGKTITIIKELGCFKEKDVIGGIEKEISSLKQTLIPVLVEKLIEEHQMLYEDGIKKK